MSSRLKASVAAACTTLGRFHKGTYVIDPDCMESVKDLIRYLKRDRGYHEVRSYLGESKVLQNDLIHVLTNCPEQDSALFDTTLRLLINLTTPTILFFGEEALKDKKDWNTYEKLVGYLQEYKVAFSEPQFWNKIWKKLSSLFKTDWTERSEDDVIRMERLLMLLRNVLHVPDVDEMEEVSEKDLPVQDRILLALQEAEILQVLLSASSDSSEEQFYLTILEILSLLLRGQNPKVLARCGLRGSESEKDRESEELIRMRESERKSRNKYVNTRNFHTTFVMKGLKTMANNDFICHRSLDKANKMDFSASKHGVERKVRRNRVPVLSEEVERNSTCAVRLFLKEFCAEFLHSSFGHVMNAVKMKLDCSRTSSHEKSYYFWALKFFLDFATVSETDERHIKGVLSTESFHFVQTSLENAFEFLKAEKSKKVVWVRRIHLILKAYRSLLETLQWLDHSKFPVPRLISKEVKSQLFYVLEYREMTVRLLLRYDQNTFSVAYLRDLMETAHLFMKLMEGYSREIKMVVQVKGKRPSKKKGKKEEAKVETPAEKWEKINYDVYDAICCGGSFPEMAPFDAALDIPIDEQKGRAMKRIQMFLHAGRISEGIGLLRSARQVWPENDCFGSESMSVEDEWKALEEICRADLEGVDGGSIGKEPSRVEVVEEGEGGEKAEEEAEEEQEEEEEEEEMEEESRVVLLDKEFDVMKYKMRFCHKVVVEGCGVLLRHYKKNSEHTNHCVVKMLHRIGWECELPAMLFQASLFWTLLKIMRDDSKRYNEINTFTLNLIRKFRKYASQNPVVFLELLFYKEPHIAREIQNGYQPYEKPKKSKSEGRPKKQKKSKEEVGGEEVGERETSKGRRRKRKSKAGLDESNAEGEKNGEERRKTRKRRTKKTKEETDLGNVGGGESEKETESFGESFGNVSRVLFEENGSEEEGTDSEQAKSVEPSQAEASKEKTSQERRKMAGSQKINWKHKTKSRRHKMTESRSEESDGDEGERRKASDQTGRRRTVLDSSDEEAVEEGRSSVGRKEKEGGDGEGEGESGRGKEGRCDVSGSSENSNGSSKKRGRGGGGESGEESEESERSKSKRVRCIGSDSEMENYGSEEEEAAVVAKSGRRRRLAVIDSDSDLETNSLDEK